LKKVTLVEVFSKHFENDDKTGVNRMAISEELLRQLESTVSWLETLKGVSTERLTHHIAPGKWTPAEIIAHLMMWDRVLIEEIVPQVGENAQVDNEKFVNYDLANRSASDYARSGVTAGDLLDEAAHARAELVRYLRSRDDLSDSLSFRIRGAKGEFSPLTAAGLVEDFISHDRHHKGQVDQFLVSSL
jgi:hypothetical protein